MRRWIINDDFLDNLPNNEEERGKKAYDNFDENNNHVFVLEIENQVVGFINVGITNDKDYLNCGEIYSIYIIKKI